MVCCVVHYNSNHKYTAYCTTAAAIRTMPPEHELSREPTGTTTRASPDRESAAQRLYRCLLEELLTWRLRPGALLVEAALAERFGTSRTPIRESLKRLAEEGFLRVIPRVGYLVLPVTVADVHEVCAMRLLLEPEAAAIAATRISPEILADLQVRTVALQQAAMDPKKPIDPVAVFEYNTYFHWSIAMASGNGRLAAAIRNLLNHETRVMFHDPTVHDPLFVTREHLALLEVIQSKDPVAAKQAMWNHIAGSRQRLLNHFLSPQREGRKPGVSSPEALRLRQ